MYRKIILQVMHDLLNDTTYVRISVATSFIHSMIFNIIVLYYLIHYSDILSSNSILGDLIQDYLDLVSFDSSMIIRLIILGIFLLIWYELLPPIGEGAQIYYLDEPGKKDGFRAFAQWLYKFFPMFELNVATDFFKMSFIMLVLIRLRLFDLIWNPLIMSVMSIRLIVSFFVHLFLPYSRVIVCLRGKPFFEAMKESVHVSINNFNITIKFVLINFVLSVRFLINLFIIIGIPIGVIYLWTRLGLNNIVVMKYIFLTVLIILILLVAYIEGIIEWFFSAARRRIYRTMIYPQTPKEMRPSLDDEPTLPSETSF